MRSRVWFVSVLLAIVVSDQLTKLWIMSNIPFEGMRMVLPGWLALTHHYNDGMAFGMRPLAGQPSQVIVLTLLAAAVSGVLLVHAWRLPPRPLLPHLALALILGGAFGNLVDRVRLGHVVDFIHVFRGGWSWPDFNVADSAITVGVTLMLLEGLVSSRRRKQEPAPEPTPAT